MFPEQNQSDPKSVLTGLRNHHKVLVHNPLSSAFTWQMARSYVGSDPRYQDPTIRQMKLQNDAHPTMSHVYSTVTLEAGETKYLPGDVAQTYVKHLIDELMYCAGHKQTVGDPVLRSQFEREVVLNTESLQATISSVSLQDQLEQQIADMNKDLTPAKDAQNGDEQAFPDVTGNREPASRNNLPNEPSRSVAFQQQNLGAATTNSPRRPGRPAKNTAQQPS